MKKASHVFLSAVMLLTACESTKQISIVNSWLNKEKMKERLVKKIYIMGLFNSPDVSIVLENALADEAKSRRYIAYRNHDQSLIN